MLEARDSGTYEAINGAYAVRGNHALFSRVGNWNRLVERLEAFLVHHPIHRSQCSGSHVGGTVAVSTVHRSPATLHFIHAINLIDLIIDSLRGILVYQGDDARIKASWFKGKKSTVITRGDLRLCILRH